MAILCAALLAPLVAAGVQSGSPGGNPGATFTLWQLPEQTHSQMMSYVIRTGKGTVVVIDGGTRGDAPYLRAFLHRLGGKVEAWFLTHPHSDHHAALAEILKDPQGIEVNRLYASMPEIGWVRRHEPDSAEEIAALTEATARAGKRFSEMIPGQLLEFDGVRVEVLAVKNPEIHPNALNNSSVVLRLQDSRKSVLFLGDLGPEGGEKLLKSRFADRLQSDYVQMAHHGQNGVFKTVYDQAKPSCCLWPTPKWLWENDSGAGKDSGPWKTLEVREWMRHLDVKKHLVTAIDGLSEVE